MERFFRHLRERHERAPIEDRYDRVRRLLVSMEVPASEVDRVLREMGLTKRKPVKITKPMSFWLPK
jgi:hypothetical protein